MLELLAFLFLGVIFGTITGLIPALHPNTLITFSIPFYFAFNPAIDNYIAFVVGLSTANTFINFLPALFLGLPEEETALSIFPGHSLVMEGKGIEAFKYTLLGGIFSCYFLLLLTPLLFFFIPIIYDFASNYMAAVIIFMLSILILHERSKIKVLFVLALSGILGLIVLNSPLANPVYILFPVFSGFFAIPNLIQSLKLNVKVPYQEKSQQTNLRKANSSGFLGFAAGTFSGIMPGFGTSQFIFLLGEVFRLDKRSFLGALGATNTSSIIISILALYLIGRARSGAAVAIEQITQIGFADAIKIIALALTASGIAAIIALKAANLFNKLIEQLNYKMILKLTLAAIVISAFLLAGFYGLITIAVSSLIGLLAYYYRIKRSYCMGVLILPTLLFYVL